MLPDRQNLPRDRIKCFTFRTVETRVNPSGLEWHFYWKFGGGGGELDVIGADVYWLCGGLGAYMGADRENRGERWGKRGELRKEEEKNRGEEEKRK